MDASTIRAHDREDLVTSSRFGLIGNSELFVRAMAAVFRLARIEIPVLLYGVTGTGKEIAARAIHYLSKRGSRPFVPVVCGTLPEALFANELFGHVQGAFTDARRDACGLVVQAEGGTLFSTRSTP